MTLNRAGEKVDTQSFDVDAGPNLKSIASSFKAGEGGSTCEENSNS